MTQDSSWGGGTFCGRGGSGVEFAHMPPNKQQCQLPRSTRGPLICSTKVYREHLGLELGLGLRLDLLCFISVEGLEESQRYVLAACH